MKQGVKNSSILIAVWCSDDGVAHVTEVTLRRARLVVGWVTIGGHVSQPHLKKPPLEVALITLSYSSEATSSTVANRNVHSNPNRNTYRELWPRLGKGAPPCRIYRSFFIIITHRLTQTHGGPTALPGPLKWSITTKRPGRLSLAISLCVDATSAGESR